ncbi:3-hydroxyisobutyrate dehydrogenase [Lacibacterium aquatile]|uniref:3-hydroxyisobutyrate dehydrogenase n=1 Tax=Lacibacterium aquatile TaxID=1168082 RepID=A0ABW5DR79_9PROT
MSKIAFIGLGNMGRPMALNLVRAGHALTVFDLNPDAVAALKEAGAKEADSPGTAAKDADVVVTMLPAGQQVKAVYGTLFDSAPAGALLIDCSTIDVETARMVGSIAADRGFAMLDAPVSGGTAGAAAGTLTFMVGGPDAAYGKALPILGAMGKTIVHAGQSGNGQAAKICNNMVLGISMIAVSEAFAMGEKLGLDAQTLFDISSKASGQCWAMTSYCPAPGPVPTAPSNRDYQPGFAAAMMLKDLKLSQEAAEASGASTPLGKAAQDLYQRYCDEGNAGADFSGIIKMLAGKA